MAATKFFVTLRYCGAEITRYEWAHDPMQAAIMATLNFGCAEINLKSELKLVSVTLPPEEIERAEAAMMTELANKLAALTEHVNPANPLTKL